MAPSHWMPGAAVVASLHDAGTMLGGNRYATWHSLKADPTRLSAVAGPKYFISSGNEVHLAFNPVTGQVAQIIPGNRGARGLRNLPGGVQTNRQGAVNIQIEVIEYSRKPWTKTLTGEGKKGLAPILAWLDSWGVPRATPAGEPAATAAGPHHRIAPGPSGHYTHPRWTENEHWDHGGVRWAKLFSALPAAAPVSSLPRPRPPPRQGQRRPRAHSRGRPSPTCSSRSARAPTGYGARSQIPWRAASGMPPSPQVTAT